MFRIVKVMQAKVRTEENWSKPTKAEAETQAELLAKKDPEGEYFVCKEVSKVTAVITPTTVDV